jgi:hypothetical protein
MVRLGIQQREADGFGTFHVAGFGGGHGVFESDGGRQD